ncbi:15497_t:CDS:2, partial [Funneliformis mosseae]
SLFTEITTKKREILNSYKIDKGFKKTATEDNRRDVFELIKIEKLLLEIRYLENDGDTTKVSSGRSENTRLI